MLLYTCALIGHQLAQADKQMKIRRVSVFMRNLEQFGSASILLPSFNKVDNFEKFCNSCVSLESESEEYIT